MSINARPSLNGNRREDFLAAAQKLHTALRGIDEALGTIACDVVHGRNYIGQAIARHREDTERLDAARAARADLYDLVREIIDAADDGN